MSELNPHDLIAAYEGRAGLLARAILFGLTEPDGEFSPAITMNVAQVIVEQLAASTKTEFLRRVPYALKWAARNDVAPEMGIYAIVQVMAVCSATRRRQVMKMDAYKAFSSKLGKFLPDA